MRKARLAQDLLRPGREPALPRVDHAARLPAGGLQRKVDALYAFDDEKALAVPLVAVAHGSLQELKGIVARMDLDAFGHTDFGPFSACDGMDVDFLIFSIAQRAAQHNFCRKPGCKKP